MQFWVAFDYQRGKAEAADVWLDLEKHILDQGTFDLILLAAAHEADARPATVNKGLTPKMPQGWLSGRRYEDYQTQLEADAGGQEREWYQTWPAVLDRANTLGIMCRDFPQPLDLITELIRAMEEAGEEIPAGLLAWRDDLAEKAA